MVVNVIYFFDIDNFEFQDGLFVVLVKFVYFDINLIGKKIVLVIICF